MILKIFSVYDTKSKVFRNPIFKEHQGEAVRAFMSVCNDKETEIGKYPEDFCLFFLGTYDCESGKFNNCTAPESIGMATEFVEVKKGQLKIAGDLVDKVEERK